MAEPFFAEIRIFPFDFPAQGWAWCDGQLMPRSQNGALFALLGTTYGGDGTSTFALPDLRGRAPMHPGQGPGLSRHELGERGGSETVALLESQLPSHAHELRASAEHARLHMPSPARSLARSQNANAYRAPAGQPVAQLSPAALAPAGDDQPHNNLQPYLALRFNIALQGIWPRRA